MLPIIAKGSGFLTKFPWSVFFALDARQLVDSYSNRFKVEIFSVKYSLTDGQMPGLKMGARMARRQNIYTFFLVGFLFTRAFSW